MRRLPPLIGLRAFEAAARHLSFKLAAEELGVTPTAVSHQVRLLEQYCGQRLFRRRPRPLTLTSSGEQLFPTLREGFDQFSEALAALSGTKLSPHLRITTTSAFAARWLLPKLPLWRQSNPDISLDIVSTYDVLDLKAGEADVAIRYTRTPPIDGVSAELLRDTFHVVGSPSLVGKGAALLKPIELMRHPLIETGWPPHDSEAPTWQRWEREATAAYGKVPRLADSVSLRFEDEIHAIEAVIAGQGLAICSDVLVSSELANGKLLRLSEVTLPGYGFYVVYRPKHPKAAMISAFVEWAQRMA
jgi:LysR family transcriptional regulator, glycine cleavage system transcriptional activator